MPRAQRASGTTTLFGDAGRCALLLERDALAAERLRSMVRAEGYATSLVDTWALFEALRSRMPFDLYAVGATAPDQIHGAQGLEALDPLLLLVPLEAGVSPYRLAHPRARLVDRRLRDPDAVRRALGTLLDDPTPPSPASPTVSAASVRRAFEPFGLSGRQLEVLELALRGAPRAEIAARLFISELTVRNHLHAIYERVGVSGRRELLGRFVQGLLEGNA